MPSLPTDNLNRFFLFGGVLILGYMMFFNNTDKKKEEITKESVSLTIETKKLLAELDQNSEEQKVHISDLDSFTYDFNNFAKKIYNGYRPNSAELEPYIEKIKEFQDLLPKGTQKILDFRLASIELSARSNALDRKIDSLEASEKIDNVFIWLGLFLFVAGIFVWLTEQHKSDVIFENQYKKVVNENISNTCQSCGMELRYTEEIHKGRYCNFCYGAEGYRLPEATIDEFKKLIQDRMQVQGFNTKQIERQLNFIEKLDRWKKAFRWS